MRKRITLVAMAVAAATALSTLGTIGAGASGANARAAALRARAPSAGTLPPTAVSGAQLWLSRFEGGGQVVAVSPDGTKVFAVGTGQWSTTGDDYATVAYDAATGAQLWRKRYSGPGNVFDAASSVAVSPDGNRVFVTGYSTGVTTGIDYATVAYNAVTGAQLWVKRLTSPGDDYVGQVTVSPDGHTVFVTGSACLGGCSSPAEQATAAYDAATGAQLWGKRYHGFYSALAFAVAVSPDGSKVFVTGTVSGPYVPSNYVTTAYDTATGATLWLKTYNGPSNLQDLADFLAVSPDGSKVFVTGTSPATATHDDYATLAYNAATGATLWHHRYNGGLDRAGGITVSPDGSRVFVTGTSGGGPTADDYATVAYNAATGAQQWVTRYNGPGNSTDTASWMAVSPTGGTVLVTGTSGGGPTGADYATVAYNAATGAQQWATRYNGPGNSTDYGYSVAVSPSEGTIFVTGTSAGSGTTIAYSG